MTLMKRGALAILGAASLLSLTACGQGKEEAETSTSDTAPALIKGLTISDARLVLAPVTGNPAAVYFNLSYAGDAALTLTAVTVEGAGMTMIHQTANKDGAMSMAEAGPIALATGVPVTFAPGGLHVMAMQPSQGWKPGGIAKVTLTLSDGTTQTFDAAVRAAGEER